MDASQMLEIQRHIGTRMFTRALTLGIHAAMKELNPRCDDATIVKYVEDLMADTNPRG